MLQRALPVVTNSPCWFQPCCLTDSHICPCCLWVIVTGTHRRLVSQRKRIGEWGFVEGGTTLMLWAWRRGGWGGTLGFGEGGGYEREEEWGGVEGLGLEKGAAVSVKKSGVGWRVWVWRKGRLWAWRRVGWGGGFGFGEPIVKEPCKAVEGNSWEG